MAIAFVATRATPAGLFNSSGTFGFNVGTNTTVGSTLIMGVALDPVSGVVAGNQFCSVTDGAGNTWLPVGFATQGSSSTGAAVAMFYCKVVRQITTTSGVFVFCPFASATTRVAVQILEYSGVSSLMGKSFSSVAAPTIGTGSSTTQAVAGINPTATDMVVGFNAIETNTAVTGDADVTAGAWSTILTTLSNSGSDLTSMTLDSQYKIVTGGPTQNWATTTAVAKNFAGIAAVFAAANAHVAPIFPEGNPNYTALAGFEGLPTSTASLEVDRGTGYIYGFTPLPDEEGSSFLVAGAEFVTPQELEQHHIAFDIYQNTNLKDASNDDIQTIYLPLRRVDFGGTTTLGSGGGGTAATRLAALSAVGGDTVFIPDATATIDLWFDPTTLLANFANSRIVNFGIQYVAYRDNSTAQAAPSQGFSVGYTDSLANVGSGTSATVGWWISAYYKRDNKYETRWFGETNLFPRTADKILSAPGSKPNMNAPWRVADLTHMALGDESLKFTITDQPSATDLLQKQLFFDYVVMVIQIAPERRVGSGIRTVNNTYIGAGLYPFTFDFTRFQDSIDTSKLAVVGIPGSTIFYDLLVREAAPASESDYLRLQTGTNAITSLFEAIGPSAQLKAFTQPRESLASDPSQNLGQPNTAFVPIVNGAPYGPIQDFTDYTSSTMIFSELDLGANGPDFGGYVGLAPNAFLQVYSGHNNTATITAPGGVQYTYLKVLVKPDPALGGLQSLNFSVQQPLATPLATASVQVVGWNGSSNDSGFGWKEVVLVLSAPITPAAGQVFIVASTAAGVPATTPWYWAAAQPDNNDGINGYAGTGNYDYAATLDVALPAPAVVISTVSVNFARPTSATCVATSDKFARFTFTNGGMFDKIVILRYDTQGEPILVGTITNPSNGTVYSDATTPWDIPAGTLQYQFYGIRTADQLLSVAAGAWNDIAPAPGAALGIAYNPPTVNNGLPTGGYVPFEFAYAPSDPSQVTMNWKSNNTSTMVPLHGVDKFVQLRGAEQRGLTIDVTVLVEAFGYAACDTGINAAYANFQPAAPKEQLSQGQQAMSPIVFGGDNSPLVPTLTGGGAYQPWGTALNLRDLERIGAPITLKFPGGHTRLMNVEITAMLETPWTGLYMAELTFTDAAPLDYLASGITVSS